MIKSKENLDAQEKEVFHPENKFQLVLLSSEDSDGDASFFTNNLNRPIKLDGDWTVELSDIIIPCVDDDDDYENERIILATTDCTNAENNGDVIAIFNNYSTWIPTPIPIRQRVNTQFLDHVSLRIQYIDGRAIKIPKNEMAAVLTFIKLEKKVKKPTGGSKVNQRSVK